MCEVTEAELADDIGCTRDILRGLRTDVEEGIDWHRRPEGITLTESGVSALMKKFKASALQEGVGSGEGAKATPALIWVSLQVFWPVNYEGHGRHGGGWAQWRDSGGC